jgi:hypothetical protein
MIVPATVNTTLGASVEPSLSRRGTGASRVLHALEAFALLVVSGCHVWVPTELGPSKQFVNGRTRLHRGDGTTVVMEGPRVEGDSIIGRPPNSGARIGVAQSEVRSVEVRQLSRGRTAAVGVVLFVLYQGLSVLIADESTDTY